MKTLYATGATLLFIGLFGLSVHAAGLVDINTAGKDELMTLNGIGEVKAQAIIDYRGTNGPFAKIEDIRNVKGIGDVTYANIKDSITVSGTQQAQTQEETQSDSDTETQTVPASDTEAPSNSSSKPSATSLDIVGKNTGIAGATMHFKGEAVKGSGFSKSGFSWNFGDGTTGKGEIVDHMYPYPGKYVLTLSAPALGSDQEVRMTVDIAAPAFAVVAEQDGTIAITNQAKREADIGGWFFAGGGTFFPIPEKTIVLPGETLRFVPAVTRIVAVADAKLLFPSGAEVPAPSAVQTAATAKTSPAKSKSSETSSSKKESQYAELQQDGEPFAAAAAAGTGLPQGTAWYAGLGGILALGAAGTFWARTRATQAKLPVPGEDFEIKP